MFTATSIDVFIAAYSGAIASYQRGRTPSHTSLATYDRIARAALAYAEEFDTVFAVVLPNELQLQEIQDISAEILSYPNNSNSSFVPANYESLVEAVIAMMSETSNVITANVTNPIPVPSPVALSVLEVPTVAGVAGSLYSTVPITAIAAIVDGYYVKGDRGGGCFYWDPTSSATDDSGTVINPTGHVGLGRWIRVYDGVLTFPFFGITTTNTATSNTTRINALLAAHPSASIYAPGPGEYAINGTLNFHSLAGAHIYGDGQNSTYITYRLPYAAITLIDFFQSSFCRIEGITFFAAPDSGTSSVDKILHAHAGNPGILAQNVFRNCQFQGGKIAGVHIGSDTGTDTNIDMNSFERCLSGGNDGVGWLISDNNNANTHFLKCATQDNGSWGWQLQFFPINTVFEQPVSSNCGLLAGGDTQAGNGYFRIEKTFGTNVFIYDSEYELNNGTVILSTPPASGGVSASGTAVIQGLRTSNNNTNGKKIFDCQAGMIYVIDDALIVGNGVDGSCSFNPVVAPFYGGRSLFTRNVTLSDGATLDVRTTGVNAMRWDGSGVITQVNSTDTAPTTPSFNSDFRPQAIKGGSLDTGAGAIAGGSVATGAGPITGGSVTVTGNVASSAGSLSIRHGADLLVGDLPVHIADYPAAPGAYSGIWMGVPVDNSHFSILSNAFSMLWNTPDAAGEHAWYCGFAGTVMRCKGTDSAPQFRLGSGTYGSQQTYTVTNHVDDRVLDESVLSLADLQHIVGTIIKDLQAYGFMKGTTT